MYGIGCSGDAVEILWFARLERAVYGVLRIFCF